MEKAINFDNKNNLSLLEKNMNESPDFCDEHGHPIFKKEMMKLLLRQKKWTEASKLIPNEGDLGGSHWHEILFARAYSGINDITNAKLWWERVVKQMPNNIEAKNFFAYLSTATTQTAQNHVKTWKEDDILSLPSMEKAGIELLERHLKTATTFLEYGAGGSTVFAAGLGVKNIHSVDSDKSFLDAVQKKVASSYPSIKVHAHFVNIGKTKAWGHPVNEQMARFWPGYCVAPWQALLEKNECPDVILIDGRFRVACFLACLLLAKPGKVILFDDYMNRSDYHFVEKYLQPRITAGRMAEFVIQTNVSASSVLLDLLNYSTNSA